MTYREWPADPNVQFGDPRLPERFWNKVSIGASGCWLWTARLSVKGYGAFRVGPDQQQAHRYSYMVLVGPIADGLQIDHLCRVRNCVNPNHLEPVTSRENTLRGQTLAASCARRTHCVAGHPLTPDNLTQCGIRRGKRSCLACSRERHHLVVEASTAIGLTRSEFIAIYGNSAVAARDILAAA